MRTYQSIIKPLLVAVALCPVTTSFARDNSASGNTMRKKEFAGHNGPGSGAAFHCGNLITVKHSSSDGVSPVAITIDYRTVQSSMTGSPVCWLAQNLGATKIAGSFSDVSDAAAGWYWQFGKNQGYVWDSGTASIIPRGGLPAGKPVTTNWTDDNNPCTRLLGKTWRLPTWEEATAIQDYLGSLGCDVYSGTGLYLHGSGYLYNDWRPMYRGVQGYIWTSTYTYAGKSRYVRFLRGDWDASVDLQGAVGLPIRCLRTL